MAAGTDTSGPIGPPGDGVGFIHARGPGAGQDGGRVRFTGTPADLVAHGDSLTAQHLRTYLADAP